MNIVTCHTNTDFDALASMVAASFLYRDCVRVLPGHVQPPVREFLAVHWDLLRLQYRKSVDLSAVRRLVVTDTASWHRLDNLQALAGRNDIETVVWDHHADEGTITAGEVHREEVGAAVTLLLERMKERDCAFTPMHATLFLLGIYDDTGCLSYPSATARDAYMAGFVLENGADLNVAAAYLQSSLDSRHLELFSRMLAASEEFEVGGLKLGVCVQNADRGLNMLPTVVTRYKGIKGLDAAFGIFPAGPRKTVVIARANPRAFDAGAVVRQLGGGGHAGAASATVEDSPEAVHARIVEFIRCADRRQTCVRDVMSRAVDTVPPAMRLGDARVLMARTGKEALLVVDDGGRLLGAVSASLFCGTDRDSRWERPVTAMMRQHPPCVGPGQSVREAVQLMARSEIGLLPVVENGRLVGQVSRAALIFDMYEF